MILPYAVGLLNATEAFGQDNICERPAMASLVKAQPLEIEGATAHVYKQVNGTVLRLHAFRPSQSSSRKLPAIVIFFGGGWLWGNVTDGVPLAKYLAGRGMIAILADYRVFCRDRVDITAEMADAKSAIRWVRAHARELRVDAQRIAASGASSGGQLALSTAVFDRFDDPSDDRAISSKPNLLVLFYPCVNETTEDERGISLPALGEHGRDVSPMYANAKGLPPMLVLQGTADPLFANVKKYCDQTNATGGHCDFIPYEAAPHGFAGPALPDRKWFQASLLDTDRYLAKYGYLKAGATQEKK
jgi:acetyl esterase/lipase